LVGIWNPDPDTERKFAFATHLWLMLQVMKAVFAKPLTRVKSYQGPYLICIKCSKPLTCIKAMGKLLSNVRQRYLWRPLLCVKGLVSLMGVKCAPTPLIRLSNKDSSATLLHRWSKPNFRAVQKLWRTFRLFCWCSRKIFVLNNYSVFLSFIGENWRRLVRRSIPGVSKNEHLFGGVFSEWLPVQRNKHNIWYQSKRETLSVIIKMQLSW